MTEQEALELIRKALEKALEGKKPADRKDISAITSDTDLIAEEIIDSLDALVFLMELEQMSGKDIPDEVTEEEGFYRVGNIVAVLLS